MIIHRETPVASPRRICSIPTNKRVEMLRNCEADLRREIAKAQKLNESIETAASATTDNNSILINKRIEVLKFETSSAPNSPKTARFSPRKTHVTNFIYQNASPTDLLRRKSTPEPCKGDAGDIASSKLSPQLQINGRRLLSPPKSPTPVRRRFRSQSPRVSIDSDTESEPENSSTKEIKKHDKRSDAEINGNRSVAASRRIPSRKIKAKQEVHEDVRNANIINDPVTKKNPLMSFRSVDMGNQTPETCYCPQSEPLKRKIYSGSQTLEKLKKNLELESGMFIVFFFFF